MDADTSQAARHPCRRPPYRSCWPTYDAKPVVQQCCYSGKLEHWEREKKKRWMNPATKHPENTGHMVSLSNDIRSERMGCDGTGWTPRACEEEEEGVGGGGLTACLSLRLTQWHISLLTPSAARLKVGLRLIGKAVNLRFC